MDLIAVSLAAIWWTLAIWLATFWFLNSVARNPEIKWSALTYFILWVAFIEAIFLIVAVLYLINMFK